jgi:hypothetical protein
MPLSQRRTSQNKKACKSRPSQLRKSRACTRGSRGRFRSSTPRHARALSELEDFGKKVPTIADNKELQMEIIKRLKLLKGLETINTVLQKYTGAVQKLTPISMGNQANAELTQILSRLDNWIIDLDRGAGLRPAIHQKLEEALMDCENEKKNLEKNLMLNEK